MFIRSSFFSLRLVMETPFMPLYVGRDVSETDTGRRKYMHCTHLASAAAHSGRARCGRCTGC